MTDLQLATLSPDTLPLLCSALDEEPLRMMTGADPHHYAPNVYDPAWWMPNANISGIV